MTPQAPIFPFRQQVREIKNEDSWKVVSMGNTLLTLTVH